MNKKETAEIKKNFSDKSGFFIIDKILIGFVDAEKNLRYHNINSCITMPAEEQSLCEETLKKVLNTGVGKNFIEYEFPTEAYEEGKPQELLYRLLKSGLKDEEVAVEFLSHVAQSMAHEGPYAVITAFCSYTIRRKNKNDEYSDVNDELFDYLLTAVCPVNTCGGGFIFNAENNEVEKKTYPDLKISHTPEHGFLFPTFSSRSTDINHVMYYTKSAAKPNVSIVEHVLGCNFVMSAENEKANFQNILRTVVNDDLDYMLIQTVNDKIQNIIEENRHETDVTQIDSQKLHEILSDIGVKNEKLEALETVYEQSCGKAALTATNLVENKTVMAFPGITLNIKPDFADKVRTSVIDGRRCILIDIDDPTIQINGLPVNLS